MQYELDMNDLMKFQLYPGQYAIVLLERALGVMFYNLYHTGEIKHFSALIPANDLKIARDYFASQNAGLKNDDQIRWNLFLKY